MGVLEKIKKYYKMLPVQLTIVNKKAAQIAGEIYKIAAENKMFEENDNFKYDYANKIEKYIVYYDIGKSELHCSDIKINHTTLDNEIIANRKAMKILEEIYKDVKLNSEGQICKDILYCAIEKNEQFDGMGFPKCVKGDAISPIGRILSVSDYIARKFIDCTDKNVLIKNLKMKSGKKFDPAVVEVAVGVVEQLYEQEKALIPENSDEFRSIQMLYQPVCDATSDKVKENEGFICLNDADRGTVMPAFYTPIAERNSRILDITKLGFELFCEDVAKSKFASEDFSRTFSINISAECLSKASFLQFVKKMIRQFSINPQRLVFGIDASMLDVYDNKLLENIKSYKDLGIKIAIDNYGVDNSSLSKLEEVEFDIIKIDRSFIDKIAVNRKTFEIVKSIIKMAEDLKVSVIAKGVDTAQQKTLLLDLNCIYMQGRLFGEPEYLSI